MPTDYHTTTAIACSQCGLLNIPERRTCKRCQAALDPSVQVRVPASIPRHATAPRGCIVTILLMWGGMFILFLVRVINPPSPTVPQAGTGIDIRGNRVAILRMVTAPPYEGIEVFDDGKAIRFFYPEAAGNDYGQIELSSDEQDAFRLFRTQWCQKLPVFRELTHGEIFYDLGVRCAGYQVKQAKVPLDQLPSIFAMLQKQLPRPTK